MLEFINGWRRKVRLLTLLMASGFVIGWVRSLVVEDEFVLPNTRQTTYSVVSNDGCIGLSKFDEMAPGTPLIPAPNWWTYSSHPCRTVEEQLKEYSGNSMSASKWLGFYTVEATLNNTSVAKGLSFAYHVRCWLIPYWSIVLPLIAISAYLIFFNPRHSNSAKRPNLSTQRWIEP